MAPVSAQPLIHQDRGQLPTLPCPGAVAEEEASPVDIAFGMRPKLNALLGHDIATRQILRCCVEHVDQRFKLGGAEQALLDDLPRQFGNDAGPLGAGKATEAMAADSTSGLGCAEPMGKTSLCGRKSV